MPIATTPNCSRWNRIAPLSGGVGALAEDMREWRGLKRVRLTSYYTPHGFQEFLAHQRLGDDLPDAELLGRGPVGRQPGAKMSRDGYDGRIRVCLLDTAHTLCPNLLRHIDAQNHEIAGCIGAGITPIAHPYAITRLAQPLLQQGASQVVLLIDNDVQGVVHGCMVAAPGGAGMSGPPPCISIEIRSKWPRRAARLHCDPCLP